MSIDLLFLRFILCEFFFSHFRDCFSLEIPETEKKSLSHLLRRGMSQEEKKPGRPRSGIYVVGLSYH